MVYHIISYQIKNTWCHNLISLTKCNQPLGQRLLGNSQPKLIKAKKKLNWWCQWCNKFWVHAWSQKHSEDSISGGYRIPWYIISHLTVSVSVQQHHCYPIPFCCIRYQCIRWYCIWVFVFQIFLFLYCKTTAYRSSVNGIVMLMDEIVHQLLGSFSHKP